MAGRVFYFHFREIPPSAMHFVYIKVDEEDEMTRYNSQFQINEKG